MSGPRTIILGASHWHVPLCARAIGEEHQIVGISDEDVSLVRGLAEAWSAPVDADWRSLVDLPDLGLAYVFGPHSGMAEKCLALIERGIPFVVEKPLGTSLAELSQVRKAAEAAGVPATVPFVQRGGPTDSWLAKAGRPTYQRTSFIAGPPSRYLDNGNPWMLDPAAAGGGCLANLAPHFVDLFLQGSNESAENVDSRLSSVLHGAGVEDHASLIITTPSGREAIIEVGYAFPGSPLKRYCSFTSAGEAGFASVDSDGSATFTSLDGATESAVIDVDSDPLYDPFVRRVAKTLEDGFRGLPTEGCQHWPSLKMRCARFGGHMTTTEEEKMADLSIDVVAKAAGVHRSTVSRAFSRPEAVKSETREHILRIAEGLGYTMSPLAQALRRKTSTFIPLIVPDITNPFFAELAKTMTQAADERGYQLLLCVTNGDPAKTEGYFTAMQAMYAPFGIVAPSTKVDTEALKRFDFGHRVVVIDRVEGDSSVPTVTVDSRRGIVLALEHLRSLGHTSIGYVSGIAGTHTAQDRMDAYLELSAEGSSTPLVLDSGSDPDAGTRGKALS